MKHFITVLAAVLLCLGASAQDSKKGTNEFSINVGYDFALKKDVGGMVTLQPEFGRHFSDQFYLGVGTGVAADDKFKSYAIPVFLRAEVDLSKGKVRPYISLQGGYDFSTEGGDGNVRLNPVVGVKVPLSKTVDFNVGFGYTRTIFDGGGGDYLGLKAGFAFNSQGRGFSKFLKKLDYNVELETFTPASKTSNGIKYKASSIYGLRLSAIAPVLLKNLYVGLSIGGGGWNSKEEYESGGGTDTWTPYLNVMARVRYKVKQATIAGRLYPFAQVDLGGTASDEVTFNVNPAIGLSYMTGKKQSIDLSLGYNTMTFDGSYGESIKKGNLRIALGYTF